MSNANLFKTAGGLLGAVLLAVYSSASLAITAANTPVNNLATVNYQVGGVGQPAIGSSSTGNTSGAGSNTSFVVDDKITFVVSTVDVADVPVTPAQTTVGVLVYKITNNGNATHGFLFSTVNEANATVSPFGGNADDFNTVTPAVFVSKNNTSTYVPANDTSASLFSLAPGTSNFVFIVVPANTGIPGTQVNGDVAVMGLIGQAAVTGASYAAGAGTASVDQSGSAWTAGVMQVIFADAAGTDDVALDGKSSSRDAFIVQSAALTIKKVVTVVSDPTGDAIPHAIPGALMQYTITIVNSASATQNATSVGLSDSLASQIPSNLAWSTGSFNITTPGVNTGAPFTCADNGASTTTQAATGGAPYTAVTCDYNKTAATTVTISNIALKPGDTATITFEATIN
jgi:hypothetical protein